MGNARSPNAKVKPEQILFPGREVKLLNGQHVLVRPWGIEVGRHMIERLVKLFGKVKDTDQDASALLDAGYDETIGIVRDTIGWSPEQFAELTFEDVLDLTQAVIEVCLVRKDGGGALGKVIKLMSAGTRLMESVQIETTVSPRSSSSSSQAVTRSRP